MTLSQVKKFSIEGEGLRYKLIMIVTLIFVLPFLILSYIFYKNNIFLEFSQLFIFALLLLLILAGLTILRQIFDRFFLLTSLIRKSAGTEGYLLNIQKDKDELHEITVSFNMLTKKLEDTTDELKHRVFELFAVKELIEAANKSLDIDQLLNVLMEKAMAVTKARIGSVLMVEPENQRFRVAAYRGVESGPPKDTCINFNESLAHHVLITKEPLIVQDIEKDPRIQKTNDPKYETPSFLSMPIFVREHLLAVLNLSRKETNKTFDANDKQTVSIMISEIGFALENARLHLTAEKHLKNLQDRTNELTRANEQLQQEVRERKRAETKFQKAKESAEAANMAKSDFLASMSHEFRTPLNHIIGFTEMVLSKEFGELNSTQAEYLTDVLQSSNHLLSLINDILDLSKVEAGKLEMEPSEVALKPLLENSLIMIREKVFKHRIKTSTDIGNVPETIKADERKLKQILYNLLSNAVKFTPDGGEIRLSAHLMESDSPSADAEDQAGPASYREAMPQTGSPRKKFVQISVKDNGVGIKREEMERIFKPFEQLDVSSSRKKQGTGLGLSLTKSLVQLHGGDIWVESAGEEKGATFNVTVPV